MMNLETPPGTGTLKETPNKGTGWFCMKHKRFMNPMWIRMGDEICPACLECFYLEVGEMFGVAKKEVPSVAATVGTAVEPAERTPPLSL